MGLFSDDYTRTTIFEPTGGANVSDLGDTKVAFITIVPVKVANTGGKKEKEKEGSDVILAMAPMTEIEIRQLTDYSITKSLENDFIVATFGDTPVSITIRGINFFGLECKLGQEVHWFDYLLFRAGDKKKENQQILDFYNRNKLSANPSARFDVAIASSEPDGDQDTATYRCVVVGLDIINNAAREGATSNIAYNYMLTMIGVKKNK